MAWITQNDIFKTIVEYNTSQCSATMIGFTFTFYGEVLE